MIAVANVPSVTLRVADPVLQDLRDLVFRRYPNDEWATFARFGWRLTPEGLVVTLASLDAPGSGDLDERAPNVKFQEQYSRRIALTAEAHALGVGVVHSHPRGYRPRPSWLDDDMDSYYSDYLRGFAPDRPFVSLIMSEIDDRLAISGRVYFAGTWIRVTAISYDGSSLSAWQDGEEPTFEVVSTEYQERLSSAFGYEAAVALHRSTVAVVGAGGTGSAVIEILARAGVGRLILIDPEIIDSSNLERIHGSRRSDVAAHRPKVEIAEEHVRTINPDIIVTPFVGALPQREVLDAVVHADFLIGCTDTHSSRLAISDTATRYLVPAIDVGVALEGQCGQVSGQVIQLARFLSSDPCALCRDMVDPRRVAQDLMSPEEQERRRQAADAAMKRGDDPNPYWHLEPQLNTVGYLTTAAASLAAGYSIGYLTGRFKTPFSRIQLNLNSSYLDVVEPHDVVRKDCPCSRIRGSADQGSADAFVHTPSHWPPARLAS
jgi:tRNA A37 threonylcarbamoyladenosine dehydratase